MCGGATLLFGVTWALLARECASEKSNEEVELEEKAESWNLVVIVTLLAICIFATYMLDASKIRYAKYLPESVVTILLGIVAGAILRLSGQTLANLITFDPQSFFIYMLPPIIFESGYSLHKGDFFTNLGSILLFAVPGTLISTFIVGIGAYVCGQLSFSYNLTLLDSLTFGALISATDPVATLAIFQNLDVNPILYMLVFGESVLNDAVAVVLFRTCLSFYEREHDGWTAAVVQFLIVSLFSGVVGVIVALFSALLFKLTRLNEHPNLETALMFILAYLPYLLAEALNLSGIMAILFCGILMSHYTHHNLSQTTQMACQQIFRTVAFMAETAIFAYMGLSLTTLQHEFHVGFILTSMVLILVARAANIFPLAYIMNRGKTQRDRLSNKEQFIMWFSGLRGAIAFSLALTMQSHSLTAVSPETKTVLVTTTLIVTLATVFIFGGGTAPLLELLLHEKANQGRPAVEMTVVESKAGVGREGGGVNRVSGFRQFDEKYLIPIFRVGGAIDSDAELGTRHSHMSDGDQGDEGDALLEEEGQAATSVGPHKERASSNSPRSHKARTQHGVAASGE